jgi:exodeoxyribonuclease V alpha subunit
MAERSDQHYFLREIFPHAGPELMRLFQGAAENVLLLRSDFHTIRDWLEIAGYPKRDEAHALLLLMLAALEEGSLCIEIAEEALLRRLRDFVPAEEATAWARRLEASADLPALIGTEPTDHRPVIAHTVGAGRFFYFQKFLRAELDFHRDLAARLAQASDSSTCAWTTIVSEVLASQPLSLDAEQRLALEAALQNNFAVISGGPGTGKTTIVLTLLRCLVRGGIAPERIALAAPTGRAAQRLTDSLRAGLDRLPSKQDADSPDAKLRNLAASTLHQLLAYRPTRNLFCRHRENSVPADVIIVDEASMIGLVLMAQLLQASAPTAKLILLGDKDQLPSVDAGAVLASLVPVPTQTAGPLQNRVVLLQTNHRSQEQIRAAAQAINAQDSGVVDRLPPLAFTDLEAQTGCRLLEQTLASANELRGFLQQWIEHAYFRSRLDGKSLAESLDAVELTDAAEEDAAERFRPLFALLDRFRLLTLVRDGAWGCDEINEFLALILRPRLDRDGRSGLFVGAPVLITRNDTARGLFNGDVGLTLRNQRGDMRVLFQRQDGCVSFPAESLPAHELGFALTVHKSQGSEYQNVMVVLPPTGGRRLLTKELIYTAITRAKSLAVICSTKEALKFAIGRKIVRESGVMQF